MEQMVAMEIKLLLPPVLVLHVPAAAEAALVVAAV
jgi:hypothetical protein